MMVTEVTWQSVRIQAKLINKAVSREFSNPPEKFVANHHRHSFLFMKTLKTCERFFCAISLIVGASQSTAWAMSPVATMNFPNDGKILAAENGSVIDPQHGFAYFGSDNSIIKISLSTFQRVDSIVLDPAEAPGGISSAVIDVAGGYAYFGTVGSSVPGEIIKVDLSTFKRVGSALVPTTAFPYVLPIAVMDAPHGYAYFGTPKQIFQLNLQTFKVDETFSLNANEFANCAVMDSGHGFLYVGGSVGNNAEVIQLGVPSGGKGFSRGSSISLMSGEQAIQAVIDPQAGFAYFTGGTSDPSNILVQVQLSPFRRASSVDFSSVQASVQTAAIDSINKKIYIGCFPAEVVKIDVSGNPTLTGTISVDADGQGFMTSVIDPSTQRLYLATTNSPIQIHRVDLASFSFIDHISLSLRVEQFISAQMDSKNGFGYFLTRQDQGNAVPATIVKIRLSDFTIDKELIFSINDFPWCWVIDPDSGFAYVGTFDSPSKILKIRLADLTPVDSYTLSQDESFPIAAGIDTVRHIAYFVTNISGKIVEMNIDPAHFGPIGSFSMTANNGSPTAMAVDSSHRMAYVAIGGAQTNIVQVDLAAGKQVNQSAAISDNFSTGFFDPQGGAAYFIGANLVKVQISNLSFQTLAPKLHEQFLAGDVDASHGFGYVAIHYTDSQTSSGEVTLLRLSDLTRLQTLTLATEPTLRVGADTTATTFPTMTVDPVGGMGYTGSSGNPASIFKFTLDPPSGTNQPPTIISKPSATPNPITGTTTALSVTATDDGGEPNLTYVWSIVTQPTGGSVTFSANNSNAAKNTTATFTKAGDYTIAVVVKDQLGLTISDTVDVTVSQTLSKVLVTPADVSVYRGKNQSFSPTAEDQFNNPLIQTPTFTWIATAGTISNAGLFTPGTALGNVTVTATAAGHSGTATVHILNNLPSTGITSPADGIAFTAPASVNISANATDSDGTIVKVEFFNGSQSLGTSASTSSPYTFLWTNVPPGTYILTVKATDNDAGTTVSVPVNISVNPAMDIPPSVSLSSPTNNALLTAPASIFLQANAADQDGTVTQVQFLANGNLIDTVQKPPYNFSWLNVPSGTYVLKAQATDNNGASTFSTPVTVTVQNPVNKLPAVQITAPPDGKHFTAPASIALTASASDSDGTVSLVEFFVNSISLGTVSNAPYQLTWSGAAPGSYSLQAKATDNQGGIGVSPTITIIIDKPNQPPVITEVPNATPNPANMGDAVLFSVMAMDPEGESLTYTWEFGDGGSGQGATVSHVYASAQTYNVNVTVTDPMGGSVNQNFSVTVVSPPANAPPQSTTNNKVIKGNTVACIENTTGEVTVYSRLGEEMTRLQSNSQGTACWDGKKSDGSFVASGIYGLKADGKKIEKVGVVR